MERITREKARAADQVRDVVLATYRETGRLNHVVRTTDVGYELARRVLVEAGVLGRHQPLRTDRNRDALSVQQAQRVLRAAFRSLGGTVTIEGYRELARERVMPGGRPWPKGPEPIKRALGARTWNEALEKVGLPPGRPGSTRAMSVEPSLRIVRELTKRLGSPPKMRQYDEVALGRGVIRAETLRLHFGRWWDVLDAAGVALK
jgi:hypothetical protein